ncbi:MAG TPA: hypothetical protein VEQ59_25220, partial [Polyangiaceae bacterium]|nr:hypothetical protein [Polyangiaceae bacterium]
GRARRLLLAPSRRCERSGARRGEGAWVIAGGVSVAAVSLAFVWARGISPRLTISLFGKKLGFKPDRSRRLSRPVPPRLKAAFERAWSRLDPLDFGLKLLEERRHLRLRYFVVDVSYGFRDPLLTGRLVGALSVLAVVLPAPIEIRQAPRWDFEDGWEISVDGRALVRPWLMALDVATYVVRTLARRAPQSAASASPGPNQVR